MTCDEALASIHWASVQDIPATWRDRIHHHKYEVDSQ